MLSVKSGSKVFYDRNSMLFIKCIDEIYIKCVPGILCTVFNAEEVLSAQFFFAVYILRES